MMKKFIDNLLNKEDKSLYVVEHNKRIVGVIWGGKLSKYESDFIKLNVRYKEFF